MADKDRTAAALRNYDPSWREKIGNYVYRMAQQLGSGKQAAERYRGVSEFGSDFVPIAGDALGVNDAQRSFAGGRPIVGAAEMGLAALGVIPGVGDALQKGGKKLLAKGLRRNAGRMADTKALTRALRKTPETPPIRAFHGSPHDFDKFSTDAIGTGEGAQAYGHGLYFAENEGVARSYRDALTPTPGVEAGKYASRLQYKTDVFNRVAEKYPDLDRSEVARMTDNLTRSFWSRAEKLGADSDDTMMRAWLSSQGDFAEGLNKPPYNNGGLDSAIIEEMSQMPLPKWVEDPGKMYEVNINANPDDFLDWDAPLSEQPEGVRKALSDQGIRNKQYDIAVQGDDINDRFIYDRPGEALEDLKKFRAEGHDVQVYSQQRRETGGEILDELARNTVNNDWGPTSKLGYEMSQRELADKGIPGIKYYDGGSRAAGEGTRNYVVFKPELIEIVRKYGLAALVSGGVITRQMADQMREQGIEGEPHGN